jgi:trans-aconitate methyltransferase
MNASALSDRLLQIRGVHWLASRFGGVRLRRLSFDAKFRNGTWDFQNESPSLVRLVEQYSGGGHILVLGCGACPIASALPVSSYTSLLGVDLSPEAVALASSRHNLPNVRFEVHEMREFQCAQLYDVILFSDSLYYVQRSLREKLLRRLSRHLSPNGHIVVAIAEPQRYAPILEMIRANFQVDVDGPLKHEQRHVLVFK